MRTFAAGVAIDRWLLSRLRHVLGPISARVCLNGAETIPSQDLSPPVTVRFSDRRTLASLLLDPEVAFGDGYSDGRIQVEGDLAAFLDDVYRMWPRGTRTRWPQLVSHWLDICHANTRLGSRRNIHQHYDLGTDFFKLWLDRQLLYTCAYFPAPSATLEDAQEAKMEYVCRKLQLQPGESVVEAGCGWGALARYMARRRGVRVRAFNISRDQIQFARRMAAEEGLNGQVEFIEDDYRNITGHYDAFVSVGMLEHVGAGHYGEFRNVIFNSIGRSGRGLLHFIGRNHAAALSAWVRKRIFPGAYPPTLREALAILEPQDYSVLDVENLPLHYARTLEHWLERYEKSADQVTAMFGPWFTRAWRLYLAGSSVAFGTGSLQLFQVVFAGPDSHWAPWTRAYLYRDEPHPEKQTTWNRAMS